MQNRAANRKYHYIYKITRDDGKYYIGLHSTDDLEDGYFGSGKRVTRSIKKHGKDRHVKEILEFLPCRETLKIREQEIVCAELLTDEQCMNLTLGSGGDVHNESTPEVISRKVKEAWQDPVKRANMEKAAQENWTPERRVAQSELKKKQHEDPQVILNIAAGTKLALSKPEARKNMADAKVANWKDTTYRENQIAKQNLGKQSMSFKQKQSAAKSGANNPNFGSKWVYNELMQQSKRIPKHESISEGWKQGRKIFKEKIMSEDQKPPVAANFIFVDRRQTGRGKSSNNRAKLLKRIKDSIRNAKPEDIDAGGVHKAGSAHGANTQTNPVKVARHALNEPTLHYDPNSGEREIVLIGNDRWLKGDEFPMSKGGGSGSKGGSGPGENGEDDFIINISRSEFFDVFFEDCELPDLKETHEKDLPEFVMKRAGFQKVGNPGQLSVIRSFKHSKARRLALTKDSRDELMELEDELKYLMSDDTEHESTDLWALRVQAVTLRISELKNKISAVGLYEDVDLRYRKSEKVQVKASDAVLGMLMDVSGSMDEDKKRIARKFFTLQYAFIAKKYPTTDLIFIAHTDEPEELTEEEFFTTRLSGGTIVSPSWALVHKIIKERYDANQTNIYLSYAGDGDNWETDNPLIKKEIVESGLLSKIRHAVYVQVGQSYASGFSGGVGLWSIMKSISDDSKKLAMIKIADEAQVFDAFKKIYKKARG